MSERITRRQAIGRAAATAGLLGAGSALGGALRAEEASAAAGLKGRINHSVCRWCYSKIPLDDLCQSAKEMGLKSIDLVEVVDFPTLKKHGLICAMVTGVPGMITDGYNRPENHDRLTAWFTEMIPKVADAGYPNMICFSGNRKGMDAQTGMENCAMGLKRVAPLAEKYKVTLCMELLNSKVNHPDYMCDHTVWGVELCKKVGSDNFKLLYDIYHMQIMEGDVIHTIRDNHQWFAHYHTGGVPGRHEIDETQELHYPAVMRAILETGYTGYVAQEFVPSREDAMASLRQGVEICDV
ncbi:MAG TPA: TIM barrel protein [Verrucomicrobiae bacterium]|jgi:hydroxypyruvate isomerase|nr:TIM barrel protein [Verrucomicrobiae bacterium]